MFVFKNRYENNNKKKNRKTEKDEMIIPIHQSVISSSAYKLDVIGREHTFPIINLAAPPVLVSCVGDFDEVSTIETEFSIFLRNEIE